MALTLPQFVVIKSYKLSEQGNAQYKDDGTVGLGEKSVFSTNVKIEAEQSKSSADYVNLRFYQSNKYWQKSADSDFIVAQSTQPDEDTSKPSCTMFEAVKVNDDGVFYLRHVQSGGRVMIDSSTLGFYINANPGADDGYLTFVNWSSLVKFPTNSQLAFKGSNGSYLRSVSYPIVSALLQFGSSDPNNEYSSHSVVLMDDGRIALICQNLGKFWRSDDGVILPEATSTDDISTLFRPVKIDDTTVALHSESRKMFCKLVGEGAVLESSDANISPDSSLQVMELVSGRRIYNVNYLMENARIFNETPKVGGTTTLYNYGDEEATQTAQITFQNDSSYSFSRSLSLTAGVSTTIEAGVLGIAGVSIEVSFEINTTLEWGNTQTNSVQVQASAEVTVPAKSKVDVSYVGTQGTCSVPFTYSQEDTSSKDGGITVTTQVDGIFTGVNNYSFVFVAGEPQPL